MDLLIAVMGGFVAGYLFAIPTHPWVKRHVIKTDVNERYDEAERAFLQALTELQRKNPRFDIEAGVDRGVAHGLKNGLV